MSEIISAPIRGAGKSEIVAHMSFPTPPARRSSPASARAGALAESQSSYSLHHMRLDFFRLFFTRQIRPIQRLQRSRLIPKDCTHGSHIHDARLNPSAAHGLLALESDSLQIISTGDSFTVLLQSPVFNSSRTKTDVTS